MIDPSPHIGPGEQGAHDDSVGGGTRTRQAIIRAVEAAGHTVERITYEPSKWDGEQVVGGWEVLCTDGEMYVGENVQILLADIEAFS